MRSALTFQSSPFKGFPVTVRWIRGFNRTSPSERSQRGPKCGRARVTFQHTTCCFLAMTALVYRFLRGKPRRARASSGHESPRARQPPWLALVRAFSAKLCFPKGPGADLPLPRVREVTASPWSSKKHPRLIDMVYSSVWPFITDKATTCTTTLYSPQLRVRPSVISGYIINRRNKSFAQHT
jgi:hypothetical protein